jgi:2'-5' RNA ligase
MGFWSFTTTFHVFSLSMAIVLQRFVHQAFLIIPPSPSPLRQASTASCKHLFAAMNSADCSEQHGTDKASSKNPNHRKAHNLTVCMIPPPQYEDIWERVGAMRKELRDPGYYRWPPHVNILYPFLNFKYANKTVEEVAATLHGATKQCPPFQVSLNSFGTFGGKQRGVLWLYPDSGNEQAIEEKGKPSLIHLYDRLVEAFPMCDDLSRKESGKFNPHMTLSHFESLEDAKAGETILEKSSLSNLDGLDFLMDRVYLMERRGDSGQFERLAEVGLGQESTFKVYDPPEAFPWMPKTEEKWVYEERTKLKARRNGNGRRGRGRGNRNRRRTSRGPRIPDTPEVIAAKRAERKAKRELTEKDQAQESVEASDN